jgi:hypothetical protein
VNVQIPQNALAGASVLVISAGTNSSQAASPSLPAVAPVTIAIQ